MAEGTRLDYTSQASVAGKLGQIGGRLIDASARQMADRFFDAFKTQLSAAPVPTLPALTAAGLPVVAPAAAPLTAVPAGWFSQEKPRLLWFFAGVAATALGVWMGAHWLR